MSFLPILFRSPSGAGGGDRLRRLEQLLERRLQRVRNPHERMQRHVAPAFDLGDPLKRRAEKNAELFLRQSLLLPDLGDSPANGAANSVGIERAHPATLPSLAPSINKVIALVSEEADVQLPCAGFEASHDAA